MEQIVINWVLGAAMALLGWLGRTLWDAVAELRKDLRALEIDLPSTYVRKIDIDARFDKIDMTLERLFDKLDHKADK